MSPDLNISIIQYDLAWEDPEKNLARLDELLGSIPPDTDLILFPETFTTGFTMNSDKLAMDPDNPVVDWMRKQASSKNAALAGSLIIREEGKIYNRLVFITPEDSFYYNKRHLFRMGRENEHYNAGTERVLIHFRGWRILPLICYDLRFPVWSRNRDDYDLMINVANWPAARQDVWNTLLKARAIENVSYTAGVNRIGSDGLGIQYDGECMVTGPKGEEMAKSTKDKEEILSVKLSLQSLREFRNKFPVAKDADDFRLVI